MLGFGKKGKKEGKDKKAESAKEEIRDVTFEEEPSEDDSKKKKKKKKSGKGKKRSLLKLVFIIFLLLAAIGASSFAVYKLWFSKGDISGENAKYKKIELKHVHLPDEMLEFTFIHFRDLYLSMLEFEKEINLLDAEIKRIDEIGKQYPDQKSIAEKEKKSWEKTKKNLVKNFDKIEISIKKIYVLFSVNREQGALQIKEKQKELADTAAQALTASNENSKRLKIKEEIPKGIIKGTVYKLKKKFLP